MATLLPNIVASEGPALSKTKKETQRNQLSNGRDTGFLGHCPVSQKSLIHAIAGSGQRVHLVMAGQGGVNTTRREWEQRVAGYE